MEDWKQTLQLIGAALLFVFAVVGAYPVARWGFTGVAYMWRKRVSIDQEVRRDVDKVLANKG